MKRFTETLKWRDSWFRRLKPSDKLLWCWLLDNCDAAGVIDADLDLAAQEIGLAKGKLTLSSFGERLVTLPTGKHFIPKFIAFQYGKISRECRAHGPIFASIEKHDLEGYQEGLAKGIPKGIHTLKDKDKEKESIKDLCTLEQARAYAASGQVRMSAAAVDFWFNSRKASGWRRGGAGNPQIASWQHDMATAATWAETEASKSKRAMKELF